MDFDSSSKFISSLAKFLQSLCNGYVEFNSGVEVIGHIYLSVDTGKKIDYILNEKVCKTDENSVTFISNSFHAQPAEKPKPPVKPAQTSDLPKIADTSTKAEDEEEDIIIMEQPESKNFGTVPPRENFHQNASSHSKTSHPSKRSFNQSFPSSHRHSSKQSRSDPPSSSNGAQLDTDSLHSESNSSSCFLPQQLSNDATLTAATESDITHLSKVFPQTFSDSVNSQHAAEERDVKPQLDHDLKVIQVKQEYDQNVHGGEEDPEMFDDSQDQSAAFPSMPYDQYYSEGIKKGQRSDYGHIGGMAQGEFFPHGAGPSAETVSGDSSACTSAEVCRQGLDVSMALPVKLNTPPGQYNCPFCNRIYLHRTHYQGHINSHLKRKSYICAYCGTGFTYANNLSRHKQTCPNLIKLM